MIPAPARRDAATVAMVMAVAEAMEKAVEATEAAGSSRVCATNETEFDGPTAREAHE